MLILDAQLSSFYLLISESSCLAQPPSSQPLLGWDLFIANVNKPDIKRKVSVLVLHENTRMISEENVVAHEKKILC